MQVLSKVINQEVNQFATEKVSKNRRLMCNDSPKGLSTTVFWPRWVIKKSNSKKDDIRQKTNNKCITKELIYGISEFKKKLYNSKYGDNSHTN